MFWKHTELYHIRNIVCVQQQVPFFECKTMFNCKVYSVADWEGFGLLVSRDKLWFCECDDWLYELFFKSKKGIYFDKMVKNEIIQKWRQSLRGKSSVFLSYILTTFLLSLMINHCCVTIVCFISVKLNEIMLRIYPVIKKHSYKNWRKKY